MQFVCRDTPYTQRAHLRLTEFPTRTELCGDAVLSRMVWPVQAQVGRFRLIRCLAPGLQRVAHERGSYPRPRRGSVVQLRVVIVSGCCGSRRDPQPSLA